MIGISKRKNKIVIILKLTRNIHDKLIDPWKF